ncbi:UvrD-helicase domain-containing protein [Rhodococcus xishaensis]|uniref:RecBCD enzyme subunit RecB n=1 Tax=Rhodococcus xishaensis TaxID=2487364 RepID=A0A3S3A5R9_9NOCA|nr:UvrD-helicase domain-containing protein [Rhodococcus xishaensis]RVW02702.1 AAA family ATPase [Rhodococcus xishaensis]
MTTETVPTLSENGFGLFAPLPTGTTVLEASAGTGKTYAIVGLAARFVAEEDIDLSQLLLVTFSRAATKELRERTRERFTTAAAGLADPTAARTSDDPLVAHLANADAEEVARRRRRLMQALSDFDAGTIVTTHSFCQRMLDGLGIAGERDPDAVLVEEAEDLVEDVIADLYVRHFGRADTRALRPTEARAAARAAIFDPQAALAPEDADGGRAGDAVAFASAVREETQRRKRLAGIRDFDDLPALLHGVLTDAEHGEAACRRVRERYRVVLVDEFQDTDPQQWGILRAAFHGHSTLVLVGDPKQAIYAFRGAEVLSYLDAVHAADHRQELACNWRSDADLVAALHYLHGGATLGHRDIVVHAVDAANSGSRLHGAPPLRVRHLPRAGAGRLNNSGFPAVGRLRERVADDVAADIVRLLDGGALLELDGARRPVEPGDIAILAGTNAQIALVQQSLDGAGVPSVLAGGSSVFETPAAHHWLRVLQALEQPHRPDRVRLAALTPLFGWTAERIDSARDDLVATVGGRLRDLSALFAQSGFAALFEQLATQTELEKRLLAAASGERILTDLRHIAQLLGAVAVDESLGLAALTGWLSDRIEDPKSGGGDRSRRLDSDAAAVQLATVHASKGLEYPIVYVPFAWSTGRYSDKNRLLLHDESGRRILDIGGEGSPGYGDRRRRRDAEAAGEDLRLLYVALTRAQCQLVLWWAPAYGTSEGPLHRIMFGRSAGEAEVPQKAGVPEDPDVARHLSQWAAAAPIPVTAEAVGAEPAPQLSWTPPQHGSGELAAAVFDRALDDGWRRTSYTALTASAHEHPGAVSEAEDPGKDDEPEEPALVSPVAAGGIPSTMNDMPYGAMFGTLVHEILEHVDTAADDLETELLRHCRESVEARMAQVDPQALAEALLPVLRTPLAGGGTLAGVMPRDRLPELDFEFPLAGGEDPAALEVTLHRIVELLRRHLPPDDVLAPYADKLEALDPAPLRGYLTGSIDAVLRVSGPEGPQFVVVDYKTNRLAPGELSTADFTRDAMAKEMMRSHYPLQAMLYAVALHRYLRWRLPGYHPATHLGGVQYLFVRGMVGPETPDGAGVFDWDPPAQLVVELSDLLAASGELEGDE